MYHKGTDFSFCQATDESQSTVRMGEHPIFYKSGSEKGDENFEEIKVLRLGEQLLLLF